MTTAEARAEEIQTLQGTMPDDDFAILCDIGIALQILEKAGARLLDAGEHHYGANDNMRGNVRHDAGNALAREVKALLARTSHLPTALAR